MYKSAIIVAGGLGDRFGGDVPKQFQLLAGKPILVHTLDNFISVLHEKSKIVLVLPVKHFDLWDEIVVKYPYLSRVTAVEGGKNRFNSVRNGMKHISLFGVVAIHDAVRPFTSKEFLNKAFELAEIYNSAIPVIEISDSLRMMKNGTLQSIDRNLIKAVQTPQVFNNQMIHQAYSSVSDSKYITDDSTVFERSGRSLHFFEGENQNIKITTPFDLIVAETILLQKSLTQGS